MIADIGLYLLPYAIVLAVGFVLGFMSRNSRIDSLQATIGKLTAELNGTEIHTSRASEQAAAGVRTAVRDVQPRTAGTGTRLPMYGPAHSATRTEPLPTGVQYVIAAEADEPVSDREYAEMHARYADE